jgi:hypothetical protein
MRSHLVLHQASQEIYYKLKHKTTDQVHTPDQLVGLKDGLIASFDKLMKTPEANEFV